jgi:hypothetical protein
MSGSSAQGQQAAVNTTQQLVNSTSAINQKINDLAATFEGLSISEDVREVIEQQLQGIKMNGMRLKLKPLEHYDGMSRPLRSWLTEANLHMENKEITEEEAKVRFILGHLKGKAWDWFEVFMRERGSKPKVEWSDRTIRVFSSYKEMSKAMIQVFGDIDERKTAAPCTEIITTKTDDVGTELHHGISNDHSEPRLGRRSPGRQVSGRP